MKNLESYGVQKMDFKEIKETDGGIAFSTVLACIALGLVIMNTDWDEVADDVSRGWNSI